MDPLRVLLVARDSDAGHLYGAMLRTGADATTVWVPDMEAAQRLLSGMQFDVLLFDVTLPSEWDTCQAAAQRGHTPPLVVITGWFAADGRFRRRAFEAGCAAFIRKPCALHALVEAVQRVRHGARDVEVL